MAAPPPSLCENCDFVPPIVACSCSFFLCQSCSQKHVKKSHTLLPLRPLLNDRIVKASDNTLKLINEKKQDIIRATQKRAEDEYEANIMNKINFSFSQIRDALDKQEQRIISQNIPATIAAQRKELTGCLDNLEDSLTKITKALNQYIVGSVSVNVLNDEIMSCDKVLKCADDSVDKSSNLFKDHKTLCNSSINTGLVNTIQKTGGKIKTEGVPELKALDSFKLNNLKNICGIASTSKYLYITESYGHRVHMLSYDGSILKSWGSIGSGNGQFLYPKGIAACQVGGKVHVFVCDSGNHRIQVFDENGVFLYSWGKFGTNISEFRYCWGIYCDLDFVYVSDKMNHRVQLFSHSGQFLTQWGGYSSSQPGYFKEPLGICALGDLVFVVDSCNHRVQVFDQGRLLTIWGSKGDEYGKLWYPQGIHVLPDGNVCVVDTSNHRIQTFSADGSVINVFGTEELEKPTNLTSFDNILYIVDTKSTTIKKFK